MTDTINVQLNQEESDCILKILAKYEVLLATNPDLVKIDFQAKALLSAYHKFDDEYHVAGWCDKPNCPWKAKHAKKN